MHPPVKHCLRVLFWQAPGLLSLRWPSYAPPTEIDVSTLHPNNSTPTPFLTILSSPSHFYSNLCYFTPPWLSSHPYYFFVSTSSTPDQITSSSYFMLPHNGHMFNRQLPVSGKHSLSLKQMCPLWARDFCWRRWRPHMDIFLPVRCCVVLLASLPAQIHTKPSTITRLVLLFLFMTSKRRNYLL